MKKLNFLGIGPLIAAAVFPWLAASIWLSAKLNPGFAFSNTGSTILEIAGWALIITGIIFYLFTVPYLLKGLKSGRIVRSGPFFFCCNPLYASIILLMIPGASLVLNSWLVLTSSLVAYLVFKIFIVREYNEMEEHFGDEYRNYRKVTPEFFPFPFRKIGAGKQ